MITELYIFDLLISVILTKVYTNSVTVFFIAIAENGVDDISASNERDTLPDESQEEKEECVVVDECIVDTEGASGGTLDDVNLEQLDIQQPVMFIMFLGLFLVLSRF